MRDHNFKIEAINVTMIIISHMSIQCSFHRSEPPAVASLTPIGQWHRRWVSGTFSDTVALALRIYGYILGLSDGLGLDFGLEIISSTKCHFLIYVDLTILTVLPTDCHCKPHSEIRRYHPAYFGKLLYVI